MRNQAFLLTALAAAVIVIGCGGGGHHSNNNSTTGGTTTTTTTGGNGNNNNGLATGMNVVLGGNGYGRVEIEYLTGQGRSHGRAVGDTFLEITRQVIQNSDATQDQFFRNDLDALTPLELNLSGFQSITTGIDIAPAAFSASPNSLAITQFVFDPNRVTTQTNNGFGASGFLPTTPNVDVSLSVPYQAEARIRTFPGRISVLQVRVSDASFYFDPNLSTYVFNRARFDEQNNSTTGTDPTGQGLLASRLSDYVRFDISGVANPPTLRTDPFNTGATATAGYVYFSGDNIALSTPASGGAFAEFAPTSDEAGNPDVLIGKWKTGTTVVSTGQTFPGTFSLAEANGSPPVGAPARLTSLYGEFNDYSTVLTGGSTFELVMFPNSGEEYDASRQGDIVAFVRSGTKITNMYFGGVDLVDGTFDLLPISFLGRPVTDPEADPTAALSGTVAKFLGASGSTVSLSSPGGPGAIRRFTFTFDAASKAKLPNGFAGTGTATVFRS